MKRNVYIGGDGSSSAGDGWTTFSQSGGQEFVSGIVNSFLGFGAAVVQSNNSKDIAISKNESQVGIAHEWGEAKARVAEAWAAHSGSMAATIVFSVFAIALFVYLVRGRR